MARDEGAMDTAEFTFCFERFIGYEDNSGEGKIPIAGLPWVFVRFNAPGESRDFVMPLPPWSHMIGSGICSGLADLYGPVEGGTPIHMKYGKAYFEFMPDKPFPLDNQGPQSCSGNPLGSLGVHWFGRG